MDSHRSPAFLISPYIKRHTVDSTMYNTTSMLRTMEFLLGLRPMTQFDAGARAHDRVVPGDSPTRRRTPPRSRAFRSTTKNPPTAPGAAASNRMNFDEADEIDDDELNDILWRAIRNDAAAAARAQLLRKIELPPHNECLKFTCASSGTCTSRSIRT